MLVKIFDNPKYIDRYTIVIVDYKATCDCLCVNEQPTHPQGFSQWATCELSYKLGTSISFTELPLNVQQHVATRLLEV